MAPSVVDIDECALGGHSCHAGQDCDNTIGSYRCVVHCGTGFRRTSDGLSCQGILCVCVCLYVLCICLYVLCVCVLSVQLAVHMCTHLCGAQWLAFSVFLNCTTLYVLRQSLSLNLSSLILLVYLAG